MVTTKFTKNDAADAASYVRSYATQVGRTKAMMVEFYTKYKNILPSNIWKRIEDEKLQVFTDYSPLKCETLISLRNSNGKIVERFYISDDYETTPMSNKFLPFVVESSTPIHIFKTLMSRSKGMNRVLVASIFNLTLHVDISKTRKFVKELPEMPLEKAYEELMTKYPQYRIDDAELQMFHYFMKYLPDREEECWDEKLNEFEYKDIMLFMAVIFQHRKTGEEYSVIDFSKAYETDEVLDDIKTWVRICDSGTPVHVESKDDLRSFLMYQAKIAPQLNPNSGSEEFCIILGKDHETASQV